MSKKPAPATPLAKADAELTRDYRKANPNWDDDAARSGIRVADYNAGWLACDTKRRNKSKKG